MRLQSSFWLGLCSHLGYRLGGDSASSSLVWLLASCRLSPHGSLHRVASQHDSLASNLRASKWEHPKTFLLQSIHQKCVIKLNPPSSGGELFKSKHIRRRGLLDHLRCLPSEMFLSFFKTMFSFLGSVILVFRLLRNHYCRHQM